MIGKIIEIDNLKTSITTSLDWLDTLRTTIWNTLTTQEATITSLNTSFSTKQTTVASLTGSINTLSWNVNTLSWTLSTKLNQATADSTYVNLNGDTMSGKLTSPSFVVSSGSTLWLKVVSGNPMFYSATWTFIWNGSNLSYDSVKSKYGSGLVFTNTFLRINNWWLNTENRIGNWFTEPGLNIQWSSSKINLNGNTETFSYSGTSPDITVGQNLYADSIKFSTGWTSSITQSNSMNFNIWSNNAGSGFYIKNKSNWSPAFSVSWNGVTTFWFTGSNVSSYEWLNNAAVIDLKEWVDSMKLISSYSGGNVVWEAWVWFHFTTTQLWNGNQCWTYSCVTPLIFESFSGTALNPVMAVNWDFVVTWLTKFKKNSIFNNNLRLAQLASDPGSATNGALYYNTASNKIRQYSNNSWSDFGSTNTSSVNYAANAGNPNNIVISAPASGIWCLGWGCANSDKWQSYDWASIDRPGLSCLDIKTKKPNSTDWNYRIAPPWQYAPYQVYCDMTTDWGWYTFYPVTGWLTTTRATDWDSCKDKWLHIFVPRTQAHLNKALSLYNSFLITSWVNYRIVWIYWDAAWNYTWQAMNSSNPWASWNWHAVGTYEWSWFLRSVTYSEPSWDYSAQCRLWVLWSDANWLTFNDWTCMYTTNTYLCSAYDK